MKMQMVMVYQIMHTDDFIYFGKDFDCPVLPPVGADVVVDDSTCQVNGVCINIQRQQISVEFEAWFMHKKQREAIRRERIQLGWTELDDPPGCNC